MPANEIHSSNPTSGIEGLYRDRPYIPQEKLQNATEEVKDGKYE